jgi:hypothetical protein
VVDAGSLCSLSAGGPWVYAVVITVIAVVVTIMIERIANKSTQK